MRFTISNPNLIPRLCEPYCTARQGKSGTGLGLYITKKVSEDDNGSIKVDSTPQIGTTFTIRLPLMTS
ncbi:MAG: ATP-binding protein [Chthoniobacterales bacterium]|nr:ATP-binding protein [Chthoniobacterales bacterium]